MNAAAMMRVALAAMGNAWGRHVPGPNGLEASPTDVMNPSAESARETRAAGFRLRDEFVGDVWRPVDGHGKALSNKFTYLERCREGIGKNVNKFNEVRSMARFLQAACQIQQRRSSSEIAPGLS